MAGRVTALGMLPPVAGALALGLGLLLITPWPVALGYALAFLVFRLAIQALLRPLRFGDGTRRQVTGALVGGSALLVTAGLTGLFRTGTSPAPATIGAGGELPGDITPVKDFYYVSKNLEAFDPVVDEAKWRLKVSGLVKSPGSFSLQELRQFEARTIELTLSCISNPVGGPLLGNALWTGFTVSDLLRRVGVQGGAKYIVWRAADGYEESLPLGEAFEQDVMLVYAQNGEALTNKHGFPLRVLIPGRYGMKQPRWITEIRLTDRDVPGYWVKRGWSKTAHVELTSRIDEPASYNFV